MRPDSGGLIVLKHTCHEAKPRTFPLRVAVVSGSVYQVLITSGRSAGAGNKGRYEFQNGSEVRLHHCLVNVPLLWAASVRERVRFAPGKDSAIVKGTVLRGERDRYIVGAKAR